MQPIVLALIPLAFILAALTTALVLRISLRLGALDTAPIQGQIKAAQRRVPNTGGIGIATAIALPILLGTTLLSIIGPAPDPDWIPQAARIHIPGMLDRLPMAWTLLVGIATLHLLGLIDDRKPLGALPKLAIMAAVATATVMLTDTRLLTMLDSVAGGSWLSILLTVLWFLTIINAFNFIDNMDGLSAGVAAIAAACLLSSSLIAGQWFVAGLAALVVGAAAGFLLFNMPPAKLFMGDGGSLVLGFSLAFLSVRATYLPIGQLEPQPYAFLTPLVILAVPLYDLLSVVLIRIRQRRSPFLGDCQHFSHRLVDLGLSRRSAVLVIWGCTLITALGGVALPTLKDWQALLVGAQTVLVLLVLAAFEHAHKREKARRNA